MSEIRIPHNVTYYNFEQTVAIPISIMSEIDANREVMQEQEQNLTYAFNKLQMQQVADQKTENSRGNSIALFVLAFALVDVAIAVLTFSWNERKAENKHGEEDEGQRKILEYMRDKVIV